MEITKSDETFVAEIVGQIRPTDSCMLRRAEERQGRLTKPAGSLGVLEDVANRCAAIFGNLAYSVGRPRIVTFAGDHGVCAEGVSPYPQVVTTQMVWNFLRGGAAINCLARSGCIELEVVDVGVIGPLEATEGLISRNVARGTKNFCKEPAMTQEEMFAALRVGVDMAEEAVEQKCNLLGFGEMGIGNTTPASAITAALTQCSVAEAVGRGTGADDECMRRKVTAIERALALHKANLGDPYGVLRCVGGLEIAAMCGFCLGAAARQVPVLTDGFIATSAAALAVRMQPLVKEYLFASHASVEPGHKYLLEILGQRPLLDLNMRLGEGTGAALAMKIVQGAAATFTGMATFDSAGVATTEERAAAQ